MGGYSSNNGTPTRTSRSGSGSGSEDQRTPSEPFSQRHHRLGSVVSATDSQLSATPAMRHASLDEVVYSPHTSHILDRRSSERSPSMGASPHDEGMGMSMGMTHRRSQGWQNDPRGEPNGAHRLLPSLSDVFDYRSAVNGVSHPGGDLQGFPFPRNYNPDSAGSPPGLEGGEKKPPTLKKEQSSAGSISSGSSYSYPRTPIDGPLPIHALLSEKPQQQPFGPLSQYHGHPVPHLLHRQSTDGIATPYANGKSFSTVSQHLFGRH